MELDELIARISRGDRVECRSLEERQDTVNALADLGFIIQPELLTGEFQEYLHVGYSRSTGRGQVCGWRNMHPEISHQAFIDAVNSGIEDEEKLRAAFDVVLLNI